MEMQQLRYVVAVARTGNFSRAAEPIQDRRLKVRDLFTEELRLALPPEHPFTHKRDVSAADLDGERLIVMKEGLGAIRQIPALIFCLKWNHPR
jgi:DNA-binding transcriptional LysR family regulator